jgi:hypothetical protein
MALSPEYEKEEEEVIVFRVGSVSFTASLA